ncbi:cytochrome P450 [Amycolatopsis sulphurea]|nr:cytochrome P450 [Amycolatopsis sulphurea]
MAPGRIPLLGHTPSLLRRPLNFVNSQRDRGPIVRFAVGTKTFYLLNDPALTRELLIDQGSDRGPFTKRGMLLDHVRRMVGNGLGTSDGDLHHRQRRMIQPMFRKQRINSYVDTMRETTLAQIQGWSPGRRLDFPDEIGVLVATILTGTVCGPGLANDVSREVTRDIRAAARGVGLRGMLPAAMTRLPLPGNRRFEAALSRLHAVIDQMIADTRARDLDRGDLLSLLLAARDEHGSPMSDQQIHDEVVSIMVGGLESSVTALSWTLSAVADDPEIDHRLHTEAVTVLDGRPGPSVADLPQLDYTRRVFTEALRMWPPGWLLPRRATTDVKLGGFLIPAGSYAVYSPYVLNHDPQLFPDPERFDPDRWLPGAITKDATDAFFTFSGGARKCMGDNFVMTEAVVVLATIAARWQLRRTTEPPPRPRPKAVLTPSDFHLTATPRPSA